MQTRREVLKLLPVSGIATAAPLSAGALEVALSAGRATLKLEPEPVESVAPLDRIRVHATTPGRLVVRDGDQQVYYEAASDAGKEFVIGGALGTHSVSLVAADQRILALRTFEVDCQTEVLDVMVAPCIKSCEEGAYERRGNGYGTHCDTLFPLRASEGFFARCALA